MRRRQELPEEAFVPAGEAERLFRRGLRKIIVLSYGWLSYADPDPRGHRLASLRTYLRSLPDADELAIFWVGVCTNVVVDRVPCTARPERTAERTIALERPHWRPNATVL